MSGSQERARNLERLADTTFDLLVIGAGITGSRVAYEAARAGMSVALVDQGDFGSGSTGASSKLLHGGFRYLDKLRFWFVRKQLRERRLVAQRVAPHLASPCPLMVVLEDKRSSKRWKMTLGLHIYSWLDSSSEPRPGHLTESEARQAIPELDTRAIASAGRLPEYSIDDTRLTLATVRAAARSGAVVVNYARVVELGPTQAIVEDALRDTTSCVRFAAAVNATGPWVDRVRRLAGGRDRQTVRLSKGTHAVLRPPQGWQAGLALFVEQRSVFAFPWRDVLLVGATDSKFEWLPPYDPPQPTSTEITDLITPFRRVVPGGTFDDSNVISAFSGLRVLPRGKEASSEANRDCILTTDPDWLVSIAGGKLTTHRLTAADALRRVAPQLSKTVKLPSLEPLQTPEATQANAPEHFDMTKLPEPLRSYLESTYGLDAQLVANLGAQDQRGFDPIHSDGPDVWAQVRFAVEHEYALTCDDILRRRTTLALRGLGDEAVQEAVDAELARLLRA
jgi:glycerol-3-phosphate dehydrogenase